MVRFKSLLILLAIVMVTALPLGLLAQDGGPAISLKDARLDDVIRMLAEKAQINLVLTQELDKKVSIQLKDNVPPLQLLEVLVNSHGYDLVKKDNIYTLQQKQKKTESTEGVSQEPSLDNQLNISTQLGEGEMGAEGGKPKNVFQLTRTPIEQVEAKVRNLLSPTGKMEINREANAFYVMDTPNVMAKVKNFVDFINLDPGEAFDARAQQRTFKINRMDPEELENSIKSMLTEEKGKYVFDKQTKTLLVTDKEEVLNNIAKFIEAADRPDPQVYIRCHVIEVTLDANTDLGAGITTKKNDITFLDTWNAKFKTQNLTPNKDSAASTFGISTKDIDFSGIVGANRNNARLLSSPNLLCYNKETSKIEVLKQIPYIQTEIDTGGSGDKTSTVEFKDAGIKLEVTPEIYSDGTVKLTLKCNVSEKVGDVTISTGAVPIIKEKKVESNVLAKDKETIVIGGILEDAIRKTRFKVPVLGDIPLLGLLFSTENQQMEQRELLIFMNIHVVNRQYLKKMAKKEWGKQQEIFNKKDTEFEFYPHLKNKLDMNKLNPDYDREFKSQTK